MARLRLFVLDRSMALKKACANRRPANARTPTSGKKRRAAELSDDEPVVNSKAKARTLSNLERSTLDKIVGYFEENPDRIFEEYVRITEAGASSSAKDEDCWNATYVYWKSISKKWLANLIASVGAPHGLTTDVLNEVDAKNADAIRLMCTLFFGVKKEEKFPRPCLVKEVMRDYLLWLGMRLGSRWTDFVSKGGIKKDHTLDWTKVTPFVLTTDKDGWVASVSHPLISAGEPQKMDDSITIDAKSWQVIHPYCDRGCMLKNKMLSPKILDFFDDAEVKKFLLNWDEETRNTKAKELKAAYMARETGVSKLDNTDVLKKGEEQEKQKRIESAKTRKAPKSVVSVPIELTTT